MKSMLNKLRRSVESHAPEERQEEFESLLAKEISNRLPLPHVKLDDPMEFYYRECATEVIGLIKEVESKTIVKPGALALRVQLCWTKRYEDVFLGNSQGAHTCIQEINDKLKVVFPESIVPPPDTILKSIDEKVHVSGESIKIHHKTLIDSFEDCENLITGEDVCVSLAISIAYKLPLDLEHYSDDPLWFYNHYQVEVSDELAKINEHTPFNIEMCLKIIHGLFDLRHKMSRPKDDVEEEIQQTHVEDVIEDDGDSSLSEQMDDPTNPLDEIPANTLSIEQ